MANTSKYTKLCDSKTNDSLTADDLGITAEEYSEALIESENCPQAEGHILVNGRTVYAI